MVRLDDVGLLGGHAGRRLDEIGAEGALTQDHLRGVQVQSVGDL